MKKLLLIALFASNAFLNALHLDLSIQMNEEETSRAVNETIEMDVNQTFVCTFEDVSIALTCIEQNEDTALFNTKITHIKEDGSALVISEPVLLAEYGKPALVKVGDELKDEHDSNHIIRSLKISFVVNNK